MRNILQAALQKVSVCFVIATMLPCCGRVSVDGETKHTVQGEAKVVLSVDIDICKEFEEDDKREQCISDVIEMLTKMQEIKDASYKARGSQ